MITILQGNCLDVLPTLESESVQCCVTSPPYWGLRDYGTATWEGGDAGCEHLEMTIGASRSSGLKLKKDWETCCNNISGKIQYRDICGKCGARRIDSQLGLEPTLELYVTNMVRVFREVKRVLRDDGTLWVNLGSSYASSSTSATQSNFKSKDLVPIPWMVAMALQNDGWYLRSDIIWSKPNPMPESVTDRPTKSHEYIFLLSKKEKYFYDAEAIREPALRPEGAGNVRPQSIDNQRNGENANLINGLHNVGPREYRNKRSVWTVPSSPFAGAHFATFPPDLIKPCILAGSRLGDTVLDPFAGSGTVGEVALGFGRKSVLIELNPKYVEMIKDRTNVTVGMF